MKLRAAKRTILPPVKPNLGIEADYRRDLLGLIDAMRDSVVYWVERTYKAKLPHAHPDKVQARRQAQDASPAMRMRSLMTKLGAQWGQEFNGAKDEISKGFASGALKHSDKALAGILKRSGFSVAFQMTQPINDAYQAVIGENVGLIKSIPQEALSEVQGIVMRSVAQGRDIGGLKAEILDRFAVTKSRAALISRDQNNKATAIFNKVRHQQLGLNRAVWVHTSASLNPRPDHLAADGEEFDIDKGMDLDEGWLQPGEAINCGCVSSPVIPGFDDDEDGDDGGDTA